MKIFDLENKIRQYQIWLLGDRCDGWETIAIRETLVFLQNLQKQLVNKTSFQTTVYQVSYLEGCFYNGKL